MLNHLVLVDSKPGGGGSAPVERLRQVWTVERSPSSMPAQDFKRLPITQSQYPAVTELTEGSRRVSCLQPRNSVSSQTSARVTNKEGYPSYRAASGQKSEDSTQPSVRTKRRVGQMQKAVCRTRQNGRWKDGFKPCSQVLPVLIFSGTSRAG